MNRFSIFFLCALFIIPVAKASCYGEIDEMVICDYVVDGDTFYYSTDDCYYRLADIDAPDSGEEGYYESRMALVYLIDDKLVYLDIDDVYGTDKYGRKVCVTYVYYNSSHVLNVNKAMLEENAAVIENYYNEFNPYDWSLLCKKDEIPEVLQPTILVSIFSFATFLVVWNRLTIKRLKIGRSF